MVALVGIGGMLNGDMQDWPGLIGGGVITGRARLAIWPPRNEQRCPSSSVQTDQSWQFDAHARTHAHLASGLRFHLKQTDRSGSSSTKVSLAQQIDLYIGIARSRS